MLDVAEADFELEADVHVRPRHAANRSSSSLTQRGSSSWFHLTAGWGSREYRATTTDAATSPRNPNARGGSLRDRVSSQRDASEAATLSLGVFDEAGRPHGRTRGIKARASPSARQG
jgi:hypothetical protein